MASVNEVLGRSSQFPRASGFLEMTSRFVSVSSAQLGSLMDTCIASVYEASEISHIFCVLVVFGVSVFSAELGSTVDTCGASVYEAFRKNFTRFTCEVVSRR